MSTFDKGREASYRDLVRLQRRVNQVIDSGIEESNAAVQDADNALMREIDKLIRFDAGPDVFQAIERAAWDAPDSEEFAELAKGTAANARLAFLSRRYSDPESLAEKIEEAKIALDEKEERLEQLTKNTQRLTEQLKPVMSHNNGYYNMKLNETNRKKIEDGSRFLGSWRRSDELDAAYKLYTAYGNKNGVRRGDSFRRANCFNDMKQLEEEKQELKDLAPDIKAARADYFQQLSAYQELRDIRQALRESGTKEDRSVNLDAFKEEFGKRLQDDRFITSFARHVPSGVGGPLILAALNAQIRHKIQDSLVRYHDHVTAMTEHLEGPIGKIAADRKTKRSFAGIQKDIESQAMMAGYLTESSAAAFRSLADFRPEHMEGPKSLKRDLQMHMAVNGEVDPAYIHEVCSLDQTLAKHFNVNRRRPRPDFEKVLGNAVTLERLDYDYAEHLKEHAGDGHLKSVGFAAGQFRADSIEEFLGGSTHFSASATDDDLIDALHEEASKIQDNNADEPSAKRARPNGPGLG